MKTGDEYRKSLKDGRSVVYEGAQIDDMESHAKLRLAIDVVAAGYD
jgi:aromatic ring hydroxylase